MLVIAIDLGGTKAAFSVADEKGDIFYSTVKLLEGRSGDKVAGLLGSEVIALKEKFENENRTISAIGISVPGIVWHDKGTVWAPNIDGWDDYPLREKLRSFSGDIPIAIESDRTCCILGETRKGAAAGCRHAIYISVGTGIGAGIMIDGRILRGANDIGGAVGWMSVPHPLLKDGSVCPVEKYASGNGIASLAREWLEQNPQYEGVLRIPEHLSAADVFAHYDDDKAASEVMGLCIEMWALLIADLVSIFNPEKVIMGGGIFGPANRFLDAIGSRVTELAQPISSKQYVLEPSALGQNGAMTGAAFAAIGLLNDSGH